MHAIDTDLASLTAADLMSRTVHTGTPLRDAAHELVRFGVHGVPVIDPDGRCVGMLSVSDLARGIGRDAGPTHPLSQTCLYQDIHRLPGGRQAVHCQLQPGACILQRIQDHAGGPSTVTCSDPYGVGTDWQSFEADALSVDDIRHVMTTEVVTARPETPMPELARLMLDHHVHRLIVLDEDRHPIGVVSVTDLLETIARPHAGGTSTS